MHERIYELGESPHTSEGYYANVYFDQCTLVIPYINFGFLEDAVNPQSDRAVFADFAYLVCIGLKYLRVQEGILLGQSICAENILYFGGFQMDGPPELIDFEVECQSAYVQLLPDSRLSDSIWVAVDSPLRNVDVETVKAFFRGDRMPGSIRRLVSN